jgi:hypothetical protein
MIEGGLLKNLASLLSENIENVDIILKAFDILMQLDRMNRRFFVFIVTVSFYY